MITVIPAAGKSSRYFGKKPKWLRTLPQGNLMIEKAVEGLLANSDRLLLIITKRIEQEFGVTELMHQIFSSKMEVVVLDQSTKSAVETVVEGLKIAGVDLKSKLIIKDSDNIVEFTLPSFDKVFSVGVDISSKAVNNVGAKSFFRLSEERNVTEFVEKKVISQYVSVGTHGFTSVSTFLDYATMLFSNSPLSVQEYFISNVLALMIYDGVIVEYVEAEKYLDLGTQQEWESLRKAKATYFIDFDGTLVENIGKYGKKRWGDKDVALESNLSLLKKFFDEGAQIIITTSRSGEFEGHILEFLNEWGIKPYQIITGLNHSQRILINDFADTNIFPSASAINVPRNGDLNQFFVL